jgi:hypothetical protein
MAQEQGLVAGDALQKLGSSGFILASILIVVGGLLMPHATTSTANLQEMLRPLGEQQSRTQLSTLLIAFGFWAAMIGTAAVYRSILEGGAAWARLGFYLAVIGTALWTISLSLDVAVASAVANWLAAPAGGEEAAYGAVASLSAFGRGIVPMTWIIYWFALAFLGTAMVLSGVYPRWLGWAGLAVSIPMIVLGLVQVFNARSTSLTLTFAVLETFTALWFLVLGIWLARKAW